MKLDQVVADFRVAGRTEMEEKLSAAVGAARKQAADCKRGVLGSQHDFDHFSVSLTPQVPFGFIREHDHACRNCLHTSPSGVTNTHSPRSHGLGALSRTNQH